MFGHDKEDKKEDNNVIHPISTTPVDEKLLGVDDNTSSTSDDDTDNSTNDSQDKDINEIVEGINASTDPTDTPSSNDNDDDKSSSDDPIVPASDEPEEKTEDSVDFSIKATDTSPAPSVELMDIKRSALEELSPLIDKLDQTPEEKTMTLLMMIQATDDQSLIGTVFNAAKEIKDDKKRAQAMLDIVNEINYFTNKKK